MVVDEARNDLIFDDVLRALEAGRSSVVITERTAHLEIIPRRLERFARHVSVLRGGQSEKQRRDSAARLAASARCRRRVRYSVAGIALHGLFHGVHALCVCGSHAPGSTGHRRPGCNPMDCIVARRTHVLCKTAAVLTRK
jgi:hypothetical protein